MTVDPAVPNVGTAGIMSMRLELPRMNADEAARERWLARRRRPESGKLGALGFSASPMPVWAALSRASSWQAVVYSIGGAQAVAQAPAGILGALFRVTDAQVNIAALDPTMRAIVLEHVLTPVFARLYEAGFPKIEIIEVGDPGPATPGSEIAFDLIVQNLRTALLLEQPPSERAAIRGWIDRMPPAPGSRRSLPMHVCVRAGFTDIDRAELMRLRIGDGIVLDKTLLLQRQLVATVAESFAQVCNLDAERIVLSGPLVANPGVDLGRWTFRDSMTDAASNPPRAEPASLGDIPVKLVFEVGRLELPLSEIESLGEGYVFELGRQASNFVEIVASGRLIGSGELVRIGDTIGVRVTRLNK